MTEILAKFRIGGREFKFYLPLSALKVKNLNGWQELSPEEKEMALFNAVNFTYDFSPIQYLEQGKIMDALKAGHTLTRKAWKGDKAIRALMPFKDTIVKRTKKGNIKAVDLKAYKETLTKKDFYKV